MRAHDRPQPEAAGHRGRGFAANGGSGSALRARRYDLVVHLTEHPRGAWLKRLAGARYGVARERATPAGGGARASRIAICCRARRCAIPSRRTSMRCAASASGPKTTTRRWCSSRRRGRSARRTRSSQAHGLERGALRAGPSRIALAVQVLAGGGDRRAARSPRGDGWPLVLTGAPDPAERALRRRDQARKPRAGRRSRRAALARRSSAR